MTHKKLCPGCDQTLNSSMFTKDKHKTDGFTTYCKACAKIRRDEYRNRDRARFQELQRNSLSRRRSEVYSQRDVVKTEKVCSNCGELKVAAEFPRIRQSSDGLASWCRDCTTYVAYIRHLKKTYGITFEEYVRMADSQEHKCLICKESHKKLVVDHDHSTGSIRGLLCTQCNTGLGMLQDDPEILQSAIRYLTVIS